MPLADSTSFTAASRLQLDLRLNGIDAKGAEPLADALRVNAELTALDVCYNRLGDEGKALLRQAWQGRSGFNLRM